MSLYAAGADTVINFNFLMYACAKHPLLIPPALLFDDEQTVSSLLCFFLVMMQYPEIQKKAQQEIDTAVGTDRLPSFYDRRALPYVDAIVKEVFRWNPVLPMGFPRIASCDDIYDGMFIPKGTMLIPNVWLFLHDEAYFKEPETFKPERFLGPEPEMDPRTMMFGFGRRMCAGRELADKSVFLTIAMVLAAFDIRKPNRVDGSPIEQSPGFTTGVMIKPNNFECDVCVRNVKAEHLVRSAVAELEEEHNRPSYRGESDAAKLAAIEWDVRKH